MHSLSFSTALPTSSAAHKQWRRTSRRLVHNGGGSDTDSDNDSDFDTDIDSDSGSTAPVTEGSRKMFMQERASSTEVAAHPIKTRGASLHCRRTRLCRLSFLAEAEFTMDTPMVHQVGSSRESSHYTLL